MSDTTFREDLGNQLASGAITREEFVQRLKASLPAPSKAVGARPALNAAAAHLRSGGLAGAELGAVRWSKADLSGAQLAGADLTRARLNGADLRNADLAGACLANADLSDADLTGADLTGADLSRANLRRAKLHEVRMTRALGRRLWADKSSWRKVAAPGADLVMSGMSDAELDEVNLAGADLTDALLDDSRLLKIDLSGANLTRASVQSATIDGSNLAKANATEAFFILSKLANTDLAEADLTDCDAASSRWENVSLRAAKLHRTLFSGSEHRKVDLADAELAGAVFKAMTGYSEQDMQALRARGARVDRFLLRRFGRVVKRSRAMQTFLAMLVIAPIAMIIYQDTNPKNWTAQRLEVAAARAQTQGKLDQAERYYQRALEVTKNSQLTAVARLGLGQINLARGNPEAAEQFFRILIDEGGKHQYEVALAKIGLADAVRAQRRYQEAEAVLLELLAQPPDTDRQVDIYERLVELARDRGDIERERSLLEKVVASEGLGFPDILRWARQNLAEALRRFGDLDGAVAQYRAIVREGPRDPSAPGALADIVVVSSDRGDLSTAEAVLRELQTQYPDERQTADSAEVVFAVALMESGVRRDEGWGRLQRLFKERPGPGGGRLAGLAIAEEYKRLGDCAQTQATLERTLTYAPTPGANRDGVLMALADAEISCRRPDAALKHLKEIVASRVDRPEVGREAARLRVRALAAQGAWAEAKDAARELAGLWADRTEGEAAALAAEAGALDAAGKFAEAGELYRRAGEAGGQADARFEYFSRAAAMRRAAGDPEGERRELAQLADRVVQAPQLQGLALLRLAASCRIDGENDQAAAILTRVAAMKLPEPLALQALQGLLDLQVARGDRRGAEATAAQIAARFAHNQAAHAAARLALASLMAHEGRIDEAIAQYQALAGAAGDARTRVAALRALLDLYRERKAIGPARATYEAITREAGVDRLELDGAAVAYAMTLCGAGQGDAAVDLLRKAAEAHAGDALGLGARRDLATCQLSLQRSGDAARTLETLLAAATMSPLDRARTLALLIDARLGEVEELRRAGRQAAAIELCDRIVRETEDPDRRAAARLAKGRALLEMKDWAAAEAAFAAEAQAPDAGVARRDEARLLMAAAIRGQGRVDEAEKLCQAVSRSTDADARQHAFAALAEIAMGRGQPDRARQLYQQAWQQRAAGPGSARVGVALGNLLLGQEQFDAAAKVFEEAAGREGSELAARQEARLGLGEARLAKGQDEAALAAFQAVVDADAASPYAKQAQAKLVGLYEAFGDDERALVACRATLRDAAAGDPAALPPRLELARLLRKTDQRQEAAQTLEALMKQAPSGPLVARALVELAELAVDAGKYDEAVKQWKKLAESSGADRTWARRAAYGLADVARRQKKYDAAGEALQRLVDDAGDPAERCEARLALAQVQLEAGRAAAADETLAAAAADAPAGSSAAIDVWLAQARLRLTEDRLDDAAKLFARAADAARGRPEGVEALRAWAEAEAEHERFAQAEKLIARLAAEGAGGAALELRTTTAQRLADAKRFDEARALLAPVAKLKGQTAGSARLLLAKVEAEAGRYAAARQLCTAVAAAYEGRPEAGEAELQLAALLRREGRVKEAAHAYGAVARKYAKQPAALEATLAQAAAYAELNDGVDSERAYRQVIAEYGSSPAATRARLGLADLFARQGAARAALKEYQAILATTPTADEAAWVRLDAARLALRLGDAAQAGRYCAELIAQAPPSHPAIAEAQELQRQLPGKK